MSRSFAGTWFTIRPSMATVPDVIDSRPATMRKRRGLAAPRGAEQHHELAVPDVERDRVGRRRVAAIEDLGEVIAA